MIFWWQLIFSISEAVQLFFVTVQRLEKIAALTDIDTLLFYIFDLSGFQKYDIKDVIR